jgi:hypothetical protein
MRPKPFLLGDGGPYYDPDDPLLAHPSLRAAAHLLAAADRAAPTTRASLRAEVLPLHPPTPRLLASPRLALDPSGATFLAPPGAPDPTSRPLVRRTLEYLDALLAWARHRHLASPYVLELLLLVLDAWHGLDRTLALCDADLRELRRQPPSPALQDSLAHLDRRRSRLAAAATGWSFWIELLTATEPDAPLDPLLALPHHLRRLSPRPSPSPDLLVAARAWHPELEPWAAAEERLRDAFESALERHRDETAAAAAERLARTPLRAAPHHFEWLALRQLKGLRPTTLARRTGAAVSTIHAALADLSGLLELPLRPVRSGPERFGG